MNVRFGAQIAQAAAAHHLDPRLLAAVAAQETGGPGSNSGRNVVGDGGHGHGLFQIDDRAWAFARTSAAMDPAKNAEAAASILADDLDRSGGDVRAALSRYNTGSPDAVGTQTTWSDGATLGYADSVLRHYAALASDPAGGGGEPQTTPPPGAPVDVAGIVEQGLAARSFALRLAEPASPGVPGTPVDPSAFDASIAAMSAPARAPTAYAAVVPWAQLTAAGATVGGSADASLADLIDAGDVFDIERDAN